MGCELSIIIIESWFGSLQIPKTLLKKSSNMSLEVVSGWCATLPTPFLAIFLVVQSDRKISQRGFPWVFAFEKKKNTQQPVSFPSFRRLISWYCPFSHGNGSKPCSPGEHQNRWQMDVHPLINCIYRYWSIAILPLATHPFSQAPALSCPKLGTVAACGKR